MRPTACLPAILLALLLLPALALAGTDPRGPTGPVQLEAFLDGLMAAHLADHDVAGATVAVVRDGEMLFSKGYGWADVEKRRPVDPATTLFRIGSVSKLFTWTAVLQLWEEGKLDLDADVNEYLDFSLPDTYPEPITLRHILTHTPGFEDRAFGLFGRTEEVSRGEWLRDHIPARVRPPGTYASYSNYASALAGYIVERVSGLAWEAYIEERILGPLGMAFATGRQPLPEHLAPYMSSGYAFETGRFVAKPFEWVDALAPAGAMSASAEALVPFMIAHLQNGRFGEVRILEEATVRKMHARAFEPDPRVNGMALGFYESSSHGQRIIGHAGGTQWFHTNLLLFPDQQLGIFVSYNSAGAMPLPIGFFLKAWLDHYYPVAPFDGVEPGPAWAERVQGYAGSYRFLRHSHTTFEKLAAMALQMSVRADEPGEIVLRWPLGTERLREVEPGYFQAPDRFLEVAFQEDPEGGYSHLYMSIAPVMAAERIGFLEGRGFHLVLFGFCILMFLSVPILMPARYLLQRNVAGIAPLRGQERALRWVALGFALLSLAFLALLGTVLANLEGFMAGETEAQIRAVLALPLLSIPLAVVIVAGAVRGIRQRLWGPWGRVHFVLFAIAAVLFLLELHYWNLLGWRL